MRRSDMGKRKFLSDPQKMQLECDGILAHPDQYTSAFLRRVKAIQAILDGKPTDEVAKELDVSRGSIDNWTRIILRTWRR